MGEFDGAGSALNKAGEVIRKQDRMGKELLDRAKKPSMLKRAANFCKRNANSLKKWLGSTGVGFKPKPPNPLDEILSERGAEAYRGMINIVNSRQRLNDMLDDM